MRGQRCAEHAAASDGGTKVDIETNALAAPVSKAGGPEPMADDAVQSTRDFLSRVVPWPEDNAPGHINLHWTILCDDGKLIWTGKPCRCVDELMRLVRWVLSRPNARDVYFCLSLQRDCRQGKNGRLTAQRSKANALALKALWIDVDVKEAPRGYS